MPKISVIVPVYNVEPYIRRCVDSILRQTFTDFELILIESASTDSSGKICDEYAKKDSRIIVIHESDHNGVSSARNIGLDWVFKNSDSDWITFVDSDDWIHRQCLELLYSYAIEKKLNIVSSRFVFAENFTNDKAINPSQIRKITDSPEQLYLNHNLDIGLVWRSIYKKNLFSFSRFPFGKLFEDMQVITPILYSQKNMGFIDEPLYYYYVNTSSITRGEKTPKFVNDLFSAHILQLIFLKDNSFYLTFESRLMRFKNLFSELLNEYGKNKEYRHIFKTYYSHAKKLFQNTRSMLDPLDPDLKEYGFDKWFTGQADDLNDLKNDIEEVTSECGKLFALIWKMRNRIQIYNKYRNLPI